MKIKHRSRAATLVIIFIAVLFVLRAVAPGIILDRINAYLAQFSDQYYAHISDLDLNLWRSAYTFEGVSVALKKDQGHPFFTATDVDVSIAWREILRGRILTDVVIHSALIEVSKKLTQSASKNTQQAEKEAKEAGSKLFPVEVEKIEIKESKINYAEMNLFINRIDGRLSHYTATKENPISLLVLNGYFLGETPIKIVGDLDLVHEPTSWVMAAELQKFNTVKANNFINPYVPLTFKKGELDIYTEIKSEKGRIAGYIKPFLKDAEVVGDDKDFKGIKHFGVEITVAFLNLLFKSNKDHTVATKVLFSYENEKFEWNMNETLSQLFKHGYREEIPPGIENLLTLTPPQQQEKKN